MSLKALHRHLLLYARHQSIRVGSSQMRRGYRGDEIHAHAVAFLRTAFAGANIDYNRFALVACQDLLALKLLSLQDTTGYRVFSKRRGCYVFLNTRRPSTNAALKSGLRLS